MPTQNETGNAFEYAVAVSAQKTIGSSAAITANSKLEVAKRAFFSLTETDQNLHLAAAQSAAALILNLEPTLQCAIAGVDVLTITLQSDQLGQQGDVRDLVIKNAAIDWEIGISAKHQSEDLKHSRLSPKIDFGKDWFDLECSSNYFDAIEPTFSKLKELKTLDATWSSIEEKETNIYVPLLKAFKDEMFALDQQNPGIVPSKLILYLIGRQDFYKVMKLNRQTKVQIFNFRGSLGISRGRIKPSVRIEQPKLPSRILHLDFVQKDYVDTLELVFDAGWHLLLRIHSASTLVEPSLKFAISLLGHPRSLQSFTMPWA